MNIIFKIGFAILITLKLNSIDIETCDHHDNDHDDDALVDNITNITFDSIKIRNINHKQIILNKRNSVKSKKKSDEYSLRRKELQDFYKKLNGSLNKYKTIETNINVSQIYKKIKNHLGNGFYLIIFDCSRPSYIDLNNRRVSLESALFNELKKSDKCDSNSKYIWYFDDVDSLSTYDYKNKSISSQVLPFQTLFSIFNKLSMCDDLLKMMRHPAYFYQTYSRPKVCELISQSDSTPSSYHQSYQSKINYPSTYYYNTPSTYKTTTKSYYYYESYPYKQNSYPSYYSSSTTSNHYVTSYPVTQRPASTYSSYATDYYQTYYPITNRPTTTYSYNIPPGFYPAHYWPPIKNC